MLGVYRIQCGNPTTRLGGAMRVDLMTREYPPFVYGGAGVHVDELAKVLREHVDLRVQAFDGPREGQSDVIGYTGLPQLEDANAALQTFGIDLEMAAGASGCDIVHSHTWYTNLAGFLAQKLFSVPLVVSAHSLEPLRPWKAEQLGGGYALSSFAEKTAYESADAVIAVSNGMRDDILRCYPRIDPGKVHVIHNGIDLDEWRKPSVADMPEVERVVRRLGIDPEKPTVVFVGRITRQKGLPYFLRACKLLPPEAQIVLCAGAPDTPEIAQETESLIAELSKERSSVIHISQMLPHEEIVAVLSVSNVFVTPSVYEPLGIVNLEAMAMGLPVVGTRTGGIPDVIEDGITGYLVPIEQVDDGTGSPIDPRAFEKAMSERITKLIEDPALACEMGKAGRRRVEEHFSWKKIGDQTLELYRTLVPNTGL